jgi:teichoic acid transport system ATP-binding protein
LKKIKELISDSNRTVMIVSHSIETVRKLCSRVIWLHEGELRMDGPTEEVLEAYEEFMAETEPAKKKTKKAKREERLLKIMDEEEKNENAAHTDN